MIMKKLSFLFALLCASVMAFAAGVEQDTWIGSTDATYNNQFKWYEIDGVAKPTEVVNIQKPGFASEIGFYITFADAGFNAVYLNDVLATSGTEYSQQGAGLVFHVSAFTMKNTTVILKNDATTKFGFTIYNDKGIDSGEEGGKTASELALNETAKTLDAAIPETFQIEATTAEGYDGTVTYSSNKEGIATVSESGLVTAVGRGTATITVTAPETENFAASTKKLTITVTGPINWAGVDWLGSSNNKYKMVVSPSGATIDVVQTKDDKKGIYVIFPSAVWGDCSLAASDYTTEGAGRWYFLSAFTAKESSFTQVCQGVTYTFDVYFEDGFPVSEYCGKRMSSGNTEAAFTWETNDEGSVLITINEVLGGAMNAAHFRGNGISIDKIKVGEEDASTYFNHSCGGSQTITLSLKNPENAPAIGTKIYVTSQIVEYTTSKDGNAYPTLSFEYTYGSKLVYIPTPQLLFLTPSSYYCKEGSITITPTVFDQAFKSMETTVSYELTTEGAGSLEDNVYTPSKVGKGVITATAGSANAEISLYCVPSDNLAIGKTVKAGYEPENAGEVSSKVVDGDTGSKWVTWANQPAAKEWLYLDLGLKYDLFGIDIVWGDNISSNYILQARDEAPAEADESDDEAWTTLATVNDAAKNSSKFTPVTGTGRYIRFHALSRPDNCIRMAEFRVFGTEWVDPDDTQNPVMVSAELASKTWNRVVIAVDATDNHEVVSYHVVNADPAIDVTLVPTDDKITVTGLTAKTAYNFIVTAKDAAGNESENSEEVAVTTNDIVPNVAAPAPTWPAAQVKSIYSDAYDFAPASLVSYNEGWWDNPSMTEETIDGNHYLHYDLYRNGMIGAQFAQISVATMEKVHIDIFASASGSVTFRPITNGGPNTPKALTLIGNQWNSFDIELTEYVGHDWTKLFQFSIEAYNAGGLVGEHISVDNIYFYRTTELPDDEAPTNVSANASESYFSVVLNVSAEDNSGEVIYSVKLGDDEVATGGGASGATAHITVANLQPNTDYNFSVIAKDEKGNAAEPVAVSAKTLAAPAPADAPTYAADKVLSILTDIYSNLPFGIQDWWAGPAVSQGSLTASSKALCIEPNNTDDSCFGIAFAATDITGFNALEMDVYATAASVLTIQVIGIGERVQYNLEAGQWNHVVLSIEGNAKTDCTQIGFYDCNKLAGTCFVQNVLFAKKTTTALDNTVEAVKAVKMIENGQLIIIKNGIRYNVAGQIVK